MIASYLKISLNQLWRHRLYSFINIAGLGVALAACILIGLFVRDEASYDSFHRDADRIYLMSRDYYSSADFPEMFLATNAPQVAPLLLSNFPEIEQATRLYPGFQILVTRGDTAYYESRLRFADANVFDFFTFDWLQGDPESALAAPNSVVLTESLATKYFGNEAALGQSLTLGNGTVLTVTGLIRDLPHNTHLSADAFASLSTLITRFGPGFAENWASNNFYTYIRLRPGAAIDSIVANLPDFSRRHMGDVGSFSGIRATRLSDIHLRTGHLQFPLKPGGSLVTVYTFIAVAICILLIACINFMNLSTARATQRAREVGMRKVLGASRSEVIRQFLGESAFAVLLALVVAIALVELLLGPFNAMVGKNLGFDYLGDPQVFVVLTAICLLTALVAGSYPAFFLSAFQSARVLRGDLTQGTRGAWFRNTLVVLQFSVAIVLMVATAVIYAQLNYARDIDPGYEQARIVVLDNIDQRWTTLKNELLTHPDIEAATASNLVPGTNNANVLYTRFEGGNLAGQGMQYLQVDYEFFETYGIDLLSGREFLESRPTDRLVPPGDDEPNTEASFILSELAVRQRGWTPETALGKWVEIGFDAEYADSARGPVIGVVPDIHFESVLVPVEPVVYFLPAPVTTGAPALVSASIRVSGQNVEETLRFVEAKWTEVYPDKPMTRRLLDDEIRALYLAQEKQGAIFTDFTVLAFVIAGIGLLGLASFNAERRTREIGVRKVMGGSVWSIVVLLTHDFSRLVLLSNLVAWPVAWFVMDRWLQNFAYRIDLTPVVFIGSGLIALCIAWVTVGGTAAKAASAKPVLALRYE